MSSKRKTHLICNAYLAPVLWQCAEKVAEAMATFRVAAVFAKNMTALYSS